MPHPSASPVETDMLLAFLRDPGSYRHRVDEVTLIQTHASYVALAGDTVVKVKKPVNLGFLDFSTLEKRRHFCHEEVRLNRRLCPNIYEGVLAIHRTADGLAFADPDADGRDDTVEYAVRMKRLEDGAFLHHMLRDGALTEAHMDRIVDRLTEFYSGETSSAEIAQWGAVDRLRVSTDENFEQTASIVGRLLTAPAYEMLQAFTNRFYDEHADLFERRRDGHILNCHGDLHLDHIHISERGVCIYDCIEFNERLRFIDVASDVAFLAMDLDFNGRSDLSRYFIRRLTETLDDPDLPRLATFYQCYRAYVRGKVEAMKSAETEVPAEDRALSRTRARRYFQLALRYATTGHPAPVLVVMGGIGTGKTTQAHSLSEALGGTVFSSDRIRKEEAGIPIYDHPDSDTLTSLYSATMTDLTYGRLLTLACKRARTGEPTVLDATYGDPRRREALRSGLAEVGAQLLFIEMIAPTEVVEQRLRQRESASDQVSDARLDDLPRLNARYSPPEDGEPCLTVSTSTDADTTTREMLDRLSCTTARIPFGNENTDT